MAAVLLISGCDWLRSTLGMPTSKDLGRVQTEVRMKHLADSLNTIVKDTVSVRDSQNLKSSLPSVAPSQLTAQFYVIVGSFKDESNASKMDGYLLKNGYKPIRLEFKNGYKVVSSGAFSNANEAYVAMRKLLELDFSPEDVWVYDTNQKLHIK